MTPKQIYEMPVRQVLIVDGLCSVIPELSGLRFPDDLQQDRATLKEHYWRIDVHSDEFSLKSVWFDGKPIMAIACVVGDRFKVITDSKNYYNLVRYMLSLAVFDEDTHDDVIIDEDYELPLFWEELVKNDPK